MTGTTEEGINIPRWTWIIEDSDTFHLLHLANVFAIERKNELPKSGIETETEIGKVGTRDEMEPSLEPVEAGVMAEGGQNGTRRRQAYLEIGLWLKDWDYDFVALGASFVGISLHHT
jgi:hypothetical protein